jgi:lipoate-protein ligase A
MITVGDAGAEQQRVRELLDAGVTVPQLMTWHYDSPAVVLGRGQRPSVAQRESARREGLALVSRSSGGGAVMAGPWMLSLTVLLPSSHEIARASLPAGYRIIGEACCRALGRFSIGTALAHGASTGGPKRPSRTDVPEWACFATVSHGELLAAGDRKIVGISQVRRRDAIAICVGVLIDRPDWESLVRVWLGRDDPGAVRQLERCTASCTGLAPATGVLSVHSLAAALAAELLPLRLAA